MDTKYVPKPLRRRTHKAKTRKQWVPGPAYDLAMSRIKELLGVELDVEVANWFGLNQSAISLWKRRGIPLEAIYELAVRTGASLDWLVFGHEGRKAERAWTQEGIQQYREIAARRTAQLPRLREILESDDYSDEEIESWAALLDCGDERERDRVRWALERLR